MEEVLVKKARPRSDTGPHQQVCVRFRGEDARQVCQLQRGRLRPQEDVVSQRRAVRVHHQAGVAEQLSLLPQC